MTRGRSFEAIDVSGQTFNYLTALRRVPSSASEAVWECRCVCGALKNVRSSKLRNGFTKSCGCKHDALVAKANRTHGLRAGCDRKSGGIYQVWVAMKGRCNNPNYQNYELYGARGVKVCDRWMNSFEAFASDMGPRPPGMSLDRIDGTKGYEPDNCRWATSSEQCRNTRRNIIVDGKCLKDVCAERGLSYPMVITRLRRGYSLDVAMSPLRREAFTAFVASAPPLALAKGTGA